MNIALSPNSIAAIAALIGDPARANMLLALMGGQALTAGELARLATISPQTASGHLGKMSEMGLLMQEKQGRHRYFRLASPEIAHVMDSLMSVAASTARPSLRTGPRDEALRQARICYDHIAGRLGVAMADQMVLRDYVVLQDGTGIMTEKGQRFFCDFGLTLETSTRRPLCRICLDWSERRPHLAGQLGAGLMQRLLETGWVLRTPESRALTITPKGKQGLQAQFGMSAFDFTHKENRFSSPAGKS